MPDEQQPQPDVRSGAVTAHFNITDKRGQNKDKWEPVPAEPVRVVHASGSVARISDYLVNWMQRAFQSAAMGERVGWDFSMIIAQANNQQAPMWLIYAEIDGLAIGQRVPGAILAPMAATYEEFQKGITELVENLRQTRTKMLQETNGAVNGVDILGPQE
jgi:hypothetical protein